MTSENLQHPSPTEEQQSPPHLWLVASNGEVVDQGERGASSLQERMSALPWTHETEAVEAAPVPEAAEQKPTDDTYEPSRYDRVVQNQFEDDEESNEGGAMQQEATRVSEPEDEPVETEYAGSAESAYEEDVDYDEGESYDESEEVDDPWFTDDADTEDDPFAAVAPAAVAPLSVATSSAPRRAAVPPLPDHHYNVFIPPTEDEVVVDRVNRVADLFGANMTPAEKEAFRQEMLIAHYGVEGENNLTTEEIAPIETFDEVEIDPFTELNDARNQLAALSVERRRRLWNFSSKAKRLEAQYNQAKARYDALYTQFGAEAVEDLRDDGIDEDDIRSAVIIGTIEERRKFTAAEWEALNSDPSIRSKAARFFAKKGRLFGVSAATGVASGFVAKKTLKGLAMAGAAVSAPIAVGVMAASKGARGILTSTVGSRVNQYTQHDKRAQQDIDQLHQQLTTDNYEADASAEDIAAQSALNLQGSIDQRVNRDRASNRNRAIAAVAIGSVATIGGAWLADHIDIGRPGVPGIRNPISSNTPSANAAEYIPRPSVTETITPGASIRDQLLEAQAVSPGDTLAPTISVVPGGGMIEQFSTGYGLSPEAAAHANHLLLMNGYYDGAQIPGVIYQNGEVVNYLRGSGDGTYHIPASARALIEQARAQYPVAA